MRFKITPQLPGAGRTGAGHHHGSHMPTSPGTISLGKMAYHTKQIPRECIATPIACIRCDVACFSPVDSFIVTTDILDKIQGMRSIRSKSLNSIWDNVIVILLAHEIYKIHFSACSCNDDGSKGTNCDRNGKCTCKSNTFDGVKCENKIFKQSMYLTVFLF